MSGNQGVPGFVPMPTEGNPWFGWWLPEVWDTPAPHGVELELFADGTCWFAPNGVVTGVHIFVGYGARGGANKPGTKVQIFIRTSEHLSEEVKRMLLNLPLRRGSTRLTLANEPIKAMLREKAALKAEREKKRRENVRKREDNRLEKALIFFTGLNGGGAK